MYSTRGDAASVGIEDGPGEASRPDPEATRDVAQQRTETAGVAFGKAVLHHLDAATSSCR
ncbi:hypothetical protein [Candidatus Laterigemmans baculatus]|uniref:hypothetical protein n=1 Tax=Candidatus Laterigemmans baculatus TaxID=2770505 RepID=UPI0013DBA1B1|nr:hypothetical protein [Candidatus Laterigemmans baculatus]